MELSNVPPSRSSTPAVDMLLAPGRESNRSGFQEKSPESEQGRSKQKLIAWVEGQNGSMVPIRTHIHFALHKKLDDYYIQIIDSKTDEVIQEIPPKDLLDMYAAIAERFGLLVDEKV